MTSFPPPDQTNPVIGSDGNPLPGTVFLKPAVDHPRMQIGEYTYASAFDPPTDWAARLAPYLFDFSPERLVIGKFCQIADGATFITASANHRYDGFSTYPFAIFDDGDKEGRASLPSPGPDTVIGNDVWIGQGARILPGAQVGDGVIIGAGAVASGEIPPYTVIAGNPARCLRSRFSPETVEKLLQIRWWDWPIEKVMASEAAICGADIHALEKAVNA